MQGVDELLFSDFACMPDKLNSAPVPVCINVRLSIPILVSLNPVSLTLYVLNFATHYE